MEPERQCDLTGHRLHRRQGWTAAATGHGLEPIGDANHVIQNGQGTLRALDRSTGAELWSVSDGSALTPALRGDQLITTYAGCAVRATPAT